MGIYSGGCMNSVSIEVNYAEISDVYDKNFRRDWQDKSIRNWNLWIILDQLSLSEICRQLGRYGDQCLSDECFQFTTGIMNTILNVFNKHRFRYYVYTPGNSLSKVWGEKNNFPVYFHVYIYWGFFAGEYYRTPLIYLQAIKPKSIAHKVKQYLAFRPF